jgi:DNA-binding NarL/FixJ family response regulator
MLHILLASNRPEVLHPFAAALASAPEVRFEQVASGAEALSSVRALSPDLVIIDSDLPDFKPLDLVSKLITTNAMINTAVVSPLSEAEFHEASEGLGVLAHVPPRPDASHAAELLAKLKGLLGIPA